MKIIDLTQTISPEMPVYPGTEPPVFKTPVSIEEDGFLEKEITLFSHTGTHVDAPAHMRSAAPTLDEMDIEKFIGRAFVIDVSDQNKHVIEREILLPYTEQIESTEFALLYSGWSKYWGSQKYFVDYPVFSEEAAEWMCGFNLKGIGIDMISVDPVDAAHMSVHHIFLKLCF